MLPEFAGALIQNYICIDSKFMPFIHNRVFIPMQGIDFQEIIIQHKRSIDII